jgi:hypothetical protein
MQGYEFAESSRRFDPAGNESGSVKAGSNKVVPAKVRFPHETTYLLHAHLPCHRLPPNPQHVNVKGGCVRKAACTNPPTAG